MNGIEILVQEHDAILRMLQVIRKASVKVMKGEDIIYEDFLKMADFVANYADGLHHGKEEKFLFQHMLEELGQMGKNLITHGMLVEHDLGRLYMSELKAALSRVREGDEESRLDVIANAVGYANLLSRHIEKENSVVFPFAQRSLKPEILAEVDRRSAAFEKEQEEKGLQLHYLNILSELEEKYQ